MMVKATLAAILMPIIHSCSGSIRNVRFIRIVLNIVRSFGCELRGLGEGWIQEINTDMKQL